MLLCSSRMPASSAPRPASSAWSSTYTWFAPPCSRSACHAASCRASGTPVITAVMPLTLADSRGGTAPAPNDREHLARRCGRVRRRQRGDARDRVRYRGSHPGRMAHRPGRRQRRGCRPARPARQLMLLGGRQRSLIAGCDQLGGVRALTVLRPLELRRVGRERGREGRPGHVRRGGRGIGADRAAGRGAEHEQPLAGPGRAGDQPAEVGSRRRGRGRQHDRQYGRTLSWQADPLALGAMPGGEQVAAADRGQRNRDGRGQHQHPQPAAHRASSCPVRCAVSACSIRGSSLAE